MNPIVCLLVILILYYLYTCRIMRCVFNFQILKIDQRAAIGTTAPTRGPSGVSTICQVNADLHWDLWLSKFDAFKNRLPQIEQCSMLSNVQLVQWGVRLYTSYTYNNMKKIQLCREEVIVPIMWQCRIQQCIHCIVCTENINWILMESYWTIVLQMIIHRRLYVQ